MVTASISSREPRDGDALDARDVLEGVLQVLGALDQRALGHVAVDGDRDRRDARERDLVDGRLVGVGPAAPPKRRRARRGYRRAPCRSSALTLNSRKTETWPVVEVEVMFSSPSRP